ncbi:MAG: DUF3536 domain-containing protein [Elusimicrobiota bacterium]
MSPGKYICIHGHFYQPPRENPWLEGIELQDSAYPYHDWNERIDAECYAPNGTSRILNDQKKIVEIANNYSSISFNFGPTLLSWLEIYSPSTYQSILEADRLSQEKFSGHGSAMAQVYNHVIMPLANRADKETQIIWGIKDFEHRFGRKPEGMWLAETAVDLESLDLMANNGIRFTILAPHQARRLRPFNSGAWEEINGGGIDPTTGYEIALPSGRRMNLFFYDGPVSRAIAFERLLDKGDFLVDRLKGAFSDKRPWDQLVHIATDGETYGHHHRYGDMALAYAIKEIENKSEIHLTNYGEFLSLFPATHEVEIFERSSWSCLHGVERWKSNCGCNGGKPGWNQEWRGPLRNAFDWLRDSVSVLFENEGRQLLKDPWKARLDFIEVILDRSPERILGFMAKHEVRALSREETIKALKILEIQRQLLLMYTSCGWFFDDLSGIETVQVIQYAARALALLKEALHVDLEEEFLNQLALAKSNVPDFGDGKAVYEKLVKPSAVNLPAISAHYAISSLFDGGSEITANYCYDVSYEEYKNFISGKARLVAGIISLTSEMTLENLKSSFMVLHLGDHNLIAGVREFKSLEDHNNLIDEISGSFKKGDFPDTLRVMDRVFGNSIYSLKTLFRDDQRRILSFILEDAVIEAEGSLEHVYEDNGPLMRFLASLRVPAPKPLQAAAELSVNAQLRRQFETGDIDFERVAGLLSEAKDARLILDIPGLSYVLEKNISQSLEQLWTDPEDIELLISLDRTVQLALTPPFEVKLWKMQNSFYELRRNIYPQILERSKDGGENSSHQWLKLFNSISERLSLNI